MRVYLVYDFLQNPNKLHDDMKKSLVYVPEGNAASYFFQRICCIKLM